MSFDRSIEQGIRPLVDVLNGLGFVSTVYSCEGHFDGPQKEIYLPTAYVTFGVADVNRFSPLYERLLALHRSLDTADLKLTYDCMLGRFTLSIWPRPVFREPRQKREAIDSVIRRLSETLSDCARMEEHLCCAEATGCELPPCKEAIPLCALVIPPSELTCPFIEPLGLERGKTR